jgi:hypothetical protein
VCFSKKEKKMTDPNYRDLLVAFYTKHAPEKVSNIDNALGLFKGREKEMLEGLAMKYSISLEEIMKFSAPQPPSWLKVLCDKNSFNEGLFNDINRSFAVNGIDQDMFYSLTELHCIGLLNTPLKVRIHVWELVKKETGRSNEVEKLKEEIVKLKNENDQLKAELQSKQ